MNATEGFRRTSAGSKNHTGRCVDTSPLEMPVFTATAAVYSSSMSTTWRAVWGMLLLACGGGCAGGGSSGSTSTASPVSVTGLFETTVLACAAGYEHANICCQGAPYKATVCTEDLTHPFGVCGKGQFAYPDPNACCLLDGTTACLQPSAVAPTADAGQQASCLNPCSPGAYPPPPPAGALSSGGALCYFGIGLSVVSSTPLCEGLCTGPSPPYCSATCPAGWSVPTDGQVDLCCQTDPSGQALCFSQAGWIGGIEGGGSGPYGNGCASEEFVNDGNSYVVRCDSSASTTCNCLLNGTITQTIPGSGGQCDPTQISSCGFPSL
jgi:hypothetical protein